MTKAVGENNGNDDIQKLRDVSKIEKKRDIDKTKNILLGSYFIIMPITLTFFLLFLWHGGNNITESDKRENNGNIENVENSGNSEKRNLKERVDNTKNDGNNLNTQSKKTDINTAGVWKSPANLFWTDIKILPEFRLIILVIFAGALGGYIHAATSFATYTGNRSLLGSWYWWYVLRPFIGIALALIFYFSLRGGILLLTTDSGTSEISPYGMAAISGLVGMFSKQAADKLREVFDTTFASQKGKGDEERANKLGAMRLVRDFMVSVNRISACELKEGMTDENVTISELYHSLKGVVTRIPVYATSGIVKYVIHQSLLFKYISEKSLSDPSNPVDMNKLTLKDFLSFDDMKKMVADSLAFVSIDATLAEAKIELGKVENCQDVFVTENGKKDEPVLGWLTNGEIAKHSEA